jgi:enoyl-CoA hydratase/carnithine racemase
MSGPIIVTRHEGWAELRIDREDKRNSMNRESRQGLLRAFDELRGVAKAIVITGTGGSFCAGMDLKEREEERRAGIEGAGEEWIAVNMAIRAIPPSSLPR